MFEQRITFDKFIRWTLVVLAVLAGVFTINYLSGVLFPFALAWLLAYLLYPLVRFVQHKLHIPFRALAIVLTLLVVIVVLALVFYLIVPPMIEQFEKLGDVAARYLSESSVRENLPVVIRDWLENNRQGLENFFKSSDFNEMVKNVMPKLFTVLGKTASVVVSIIASFITLLYTFFILLDYENLTENWVKVFPRKYRPFWQDLMKDVQRELNNYIRGQGLVALCMGIMFCIGFTIVGFPMAIGLGILIGILDLVPYLHTFALIPTALLALLKAADTGQNFWFVFGVAVLIFIIVQVITDMVVTPRVMGKAMGLNPVVLLLSLSVWGALLGFIGLIVALPLTTLLIAYWQRYVTREHEDTVQER